MTVHDAMSEKVLTASESDTVAYVARMMRDHGIGSVVIIEFGKIIGIITERDLVRRVLASNLDPEKIKVSEIMSKPVHTVSSDMEVSEAAQQMSERNVRRLPVVDSGKLAGIITERDLLRVAPPLVHALRSLADIAKDSSDPIKAYYKQKEVKEELEKAKRRK